MKPEATSNCKTCGVRVPVGLDFCPVCALTGAVGDAGETSQFDVDLPHSLAAFRFDHYEILTREDGTPLELGRGAMGVTYKAIDINLQCAVALKVINARFIGDESARRRFVREARSAAGVRHPNVASVFHLGQSGDGYFYAMEFVEGETLENVIKRTGQLELELVLQIAVQVASGLAAVHKAKLVHRDIKPSNIMVNSEEGGATIAKIIDLGLAKTVGETSPESAISVPGGFAGTPEFASPEQFAGVGVDIRSDLYSLGITLWVMLTGRPPFRGTPAELTYQHQHGVLPLKQLKGVPRQVTRVLKALLNKDPKGRFETPAELLKTLSMVRSELEKAADQKHEVQEPLAQKSRVTSEQPRSEPAYAEGLIEVSSSGFGFLRDPRRNYVQSPQDISVTPQVVRKYALRDGLWIKGEIRRGSRGSQLSRLTEINGEHPDRYRNLPVFEELTSLNPKSRIRLETVPDRYTTRVLDLMTPVGKGQRGLIVAPPQSGKTTLLEHIADAVLRNHPEVSLIILLVDERREEVTEIRRTVPKADIMASSNDSDFKGHICIAQLAIERAKRLVEAGKDVLILMDSLTRVGRAFNNAMSNSERTMSDRMDARAMEMLRKLFAAARNTEEAGSLTIIATALIETGSKMDDLIFKEFKGTGNVEILLDRQISDQGVYPAIDIFKSGTRREELLIPANDLEKVKSIRRGLARYRPVEAIERLLSFLRKFPTNAQLLQEIEGAVSYRRTKSGRPTPQERSIAVLPFESLSANKKDTYFADGVQDEILSNLAKVSQLKVISRSSVMIYRPEAARNLAVIANELGVARVIEGTLRRSGNRVRIATRLVDAQTGETLWSESYDRNLSDIFTVQSEIARSVAGKLRAQLSPREQKDIQEELTDNLEAYDLYLQAKQLLNSVVLIGIEKERFTKAINLLAEATQKDAQFALAYCMLAKAHDTLYSDQIDHTPERRALGDAAVNEALRLRPDLPEAHLAAARHLYICDRDFERARVQIAIAAQALPNNPDLLQLTAAIDRVRGQWEKSTTDLERAAGLDPRNPAILDDLSNNYECLQRYRDAERILDRLINLEPHQPKFPLIKARISFKEKADFDAPLAAYEALPSSVKDDPQVRAYGFHYAICARDFAAAEQIFSIDQNEESFFFGAYVQSQIVVLWLEFIQGSHPTLDRFGAALEQLYRQVEADPTNPFLVSALASTDVALGLQEEGIEKARRAMEMRPVSEDAVDGTLIAIRFAVVCAWAKRLDLAFEQLYTTIRMPNDWLTYGDLKTNPTWDPLRMDPRFEKLLAQLAPNDGLQVPPSSTSRVRTHNRSVRSGPKKISVARLPVTGSDLFGREEEIAFLDDAWANKDINVVTIVAWAGVGKSTVINHWLRRMAADHYRSAELVFGWSFYRQGTGGETSSADEFIDAALHWFGDPDPRLGTAWEKGERLAKLVADRRTLLILDGLEPLQNPPGPQEGRLRDPALQALLRELAAFNRGLCVITTRTAVADITDHERTSAPRCDLEQLSSDAGAKLLRAVGVKGDEADLRNASEEFGGHCLALTLLGSYLADAYNGDIDSRSQVSGYLVHDVRQGVHARKVMESCKAWLGEGSELSVLRMLGLFDRPAEGKAFEALLKSPAIPGLTESLTDLSPVEWRTILAKLRRARLVAGEDPHNPGHLDTHPLVREYFGEQLQNQQTDAWKECNRRLFHYYQTLAPELPNSLREMESLFSAVICGCNAGLFREALHDVYIPRIQRGDAHFAANVLGATGPLLLILGHFFERGRWGSLLETAIKGQRLTEEDQLFVLMQAGLYLTVTRGMAAPEARICYERAEPLCHSVNRPRLLFMQLLGQFRYALMTDKLSTAMQIAERVHALAQEQNDATLMIEAYRALACALYYLGDFESARQYAMRGLQIWRSGNASFSSSMVDFQPPIISCLCHGAMSAWYLGETSSCQANMDEAILIAKELNDMKGVAYALAWAAGVACVERDPIAVDRIASDLIDVSTRRNFVNWLAIGVIYRGWARSASGNTAEGIPCIEQGIRDYRATGSLAGLPFYLSCKAEALHLADRASEALEAINEAVAIAERCEYRYCSPELDRLRGVFLTAMGADEAQIEASFCEAIRIAKEQKSVSLQKRAEATYAEYRRQKASRPGARGVRLSI